MHMIARSLLGLAVLSVGSVATGLGGAPEVSLMRVPDGGVQPQVAAGKDGTVHLIYLKGDPRASDVFYVKRPPGQKEFSKPVRVNSQPGTAVAAGTIRGAQLALGKNDRVHVAWNGPHVHGVQPPAPSTMYYTRLDDAGSAFEPQRNVMTWTTMLDGGGSVAADDRGNVYVVWHGAPPDNTRGEGGRAVFVARSRDEGKTFAREARANPDDTGACPCCGLKAFADRAGNLFTLYRAARQTMNRDTTLLASTDAGQTFRSLTLDKWFYGKCPMSSFSFGQSEGSVLAAWETDGQVFFTQVSPGLAPTMKRLAPSGKGARKHPVPVANNRGETLLVWTEGTGWQKGGAVAWQVFDKAGKPTDKTGQADGVPVWSFAAAFAEPDGRFVILH